MEIKRFDVYLDTDKVKVLRVDEPIFSDIQIDEERGLYLRAILREESNCYHIQTIIYSKANDISYTVNGDKFDNILKIFRVIDISYNYKKGYSNRLYLVKIKPLSVDNICYITPITLNGYKDSNISILLPNLLHNSFETNKDLFDIYMKIIFAIRCCVDYDSSLTPREINSWKAIIQLIYDKSNYYSLNIPFDTHVNKSKIHVSEGDFEADLSFEHTEDELIDKLTGYVGVLVSYMYSYIKDTSHKNYHIRSNRKFIDKLIQECYYCLYI